METTLSPVHIPMHLQIQDAGVRITAQADTANAPITISENNARIPVEPGGVASIPVHAQSDTVTVRANADAAVLIDGDAKPYAGPYTVRPGFEQQVLPTKHKSMSDDVAVLAIEVSIVSNLSGGNTVYIGGVFDG